MDKNIEKALERVRKLISKNQIEKADSLLTKELESDPSNPDFLSLQLFLALKYKPWQLALRLLERTIRFAPIQTLLNSENASQMFSVFKENPAFKSSLFEYLLNQQHYPAFLYILDIGGQKECENLVVSWNTAAEQISDPVASSNWYFAAGIACLKCHDMDGFKSAWVRAVQKAPGVLPAIIAFCQRTGVIDLEGTEERIFLIELFLHSGAVGKGLTLMKVMGNESQENARLLIQRFRDFKIDEVHRAELCLLKTNLGIFAEDVQLLKSLQGEWQGLNSEQLFQVQKGISQGVINVNSRKKLLLGVVQAYFSIEDWESSAQLLEGLEREGKDPEIMALMEHLLERYPIIPRLHALVGDFQLERGMISQAVQHYAMLMEVPEYRHVSIKKLEHAMLEENSMELAESLVDFYSNGSTMIAALGLYLVLSNQDIGSCPWFPQKFLDKMPGKGLDPIWYLFLILTSFETHDFRAGANHIMRFIDAFPRECYEIIPLIEANCNPLSEYTVAIVALINRKLEILNFRDAWVQTVELLERASSISHNLENSDFFKTLHEIGDLMEKREFSTGFQMLQRMAVKYEDATDDILKFLDTHERSCSDQMEWAETKMSILLRCEKFTELIQFSKSLLVDSRFRKNISTIHQYIGWAYQSLNHFGDAIEHFCYGSMDPKWFRKNLEFFKTHLFHGYEKMIPNVLTLIHQFGDDVAAQEFSDIWYEHIPKDITKIHKFNDDFYAKQPTARSTCSLVLWAVTDRDFARAREILKNLDPRDPQYGLFLPKIVEVFKLKQPQDPTARFLLGRFYLYQNETAQAVNEFRSLIQELPHTLEDVFIYLKKAMNKRISHVDPQLICGLLIRISIDQKLYRESVGLLREFGKSDQKAAANFVEGIIKVLRKNPSEKQAIFELLRLNAEWGDYSKVCDIEEMGLLAGEMHRDRMEWLNTASTVPRLQFRAAAIQSSILFSIRSFDECRNLILTKLGDALSSSGTPEMLEIANKLMERFPADGSLKRLVAFSYWNNDRYFEARPLFDELFSSPDPTFSLEAFAVLKEMGGNPSFQKLLEVCGQEKDEVLGRLARIYDSLKEAELAQVKSGSKKPTDDMFFWLLDQGRLKEFARCLQETEAERPKESVQLLQAYYLRSKGQINQAAFRLLHESCPVELKKMFFMEAGLWEQALLVHESEQEDLILKKRAWALHGKPKIAELHISHLSKLKETREGEGSHG